MCVQFNSNASLTICWYQNSQNLKPIHVGKFTYPIGVYSYQKGIRDLLISHYHIEHTMPIPDDFTVLHQNSLM